MISKLELIEDLIYLIGKQYLMFGLPKVNEFMNYNRVIFKPVIVNTILIIMIIKNMLNILFKNTILSNIFVDFSKDWDFGIQWKLFENIVIISGLIIQFIVYSNFKNNQISKIILLEFKNKRLIKLNLNSFKIFKLVFNSSLIFFSFLYFLVALNNTIELNIQLIFSIFWATIYFLSASYLQNIMYWKLFLFILYCFRSKLLLKYQNNILIESINKRKPMKHFSVLNNLKHYNEIYRQINDWNKFWSKYIAINLIYFSLIIGLLTLQLYFASLNSIIRIFVHLVVIICFTFITSLVLTASTVNTESNYTYKLLSSIYVMNIEFGFQRFLIFYTNIKVSIDNI